MKTVRQFFLLSLCVILLSGCFSLVTWYYLPAFLHTQTTYTSPLPSFLTFSDNQEVRFLDLWLPLLNQTQAQAADQYTAHSILMFDMNANKTLLEKNARQRMPMASLTKIMTAIIALEHPKGDDAYNVYKEDIVGEDSMGLGAGETLSLQDLLAGLFLNSGNDAAETIASNYSGGREAFITAMNQKAAALGLTDTHFTNPTGLQGDGDQHTTAYDLLVMTSYLLNNFPQVIDIASQYSYDLPKTATHKEYNMTNETNLITTYPGVKGLKTGFTPEAGLCLITYLEYDNQKVLGIILNSENRRDEMKRLLDYSLQSLQITPPPYSG